MRTCWASSSWVHTETLWTNLIHLKCSSVHMRPLLHCRYLSFTDVKSWDWFDIFQSRGWDFSSLGVPQYLNMRSPTASATPALILHLIPLFLLSSSVHSSWFLSVQLLPIHCCHGSVSRDGGEGKETERLWDCLQSQHHRGPWQMTKTSTAPWCYTSRWTGVRLGCRKV